MASNNETSLKKLEIRKYPNRRYYDVTRSQHLTLEDIRSLVRDGYDIRVTDSKSSTDITAKVLAQIILELDAEKIDMFPVALLMRLIRVNDRLVQDFMERYFEQALSMFLQYRQQFEEQLRGGDGFGGLYSSLANWNRAMLNPFAMPLMGGLGGTPGTTGGSSKPDADAQVLQEKVSTLEQQLASLETKLAEADRRPQPRSRRMKKE
jgi:polyhydroxyalkanoate synthesis repressor PhaR